MRPRLSPVGHLGQQYLFIVVQDNLFSCPGGGVSIVFLFWKRFCLSLEVSNGVLGVVSRLDEISDQRDLLANGKADRDLRDPP